MQAQELKIVYEETAADFFKLIQRKKIRLQEYALRPNVNQKALEIQQEELNKLYVAYKQHKELFEEYELALKEAFQRGYATKEKELKEIEKYERYTQDKETLRHSSIMKAMKDFPNLY